MITQLECRTFDRPDDQLDFRHHGRIDIVKMADGSTGMHALLKPGWTWAADEKPLLGNPDSCPMAHTGYCIRGELSVRMVGTGEERVIRAGEFFEVPPHHDAHVPGTEACEMVFFEPPVAERAEAQTSHDGDGTIIDDRAQEQMTG